MIGTLCYDKDHKKYHLYAKDIDNIYHIEGEISPSMWYNIFGYRIDYVYVWDGAFTFALIDNFADIHSLINYDLIINKNGYKPRCNQEAISYRDGNGAYYQRKLWLKSKNNLTGDRHLRLHAISFINVSNFFASQSFEEMAKAFNINESSCLSETAESLFKLIENFNAYCFEITGLNIFNYFGKPLFWSMGGISKAYYLKLFNEYNQLLYADCFPQNKEQEYYFRHYNLLLPGILYLKDTEKHHNVYKYDCNSLFPFTERDLPALGIPIKVDENAIADLERFEYIAVFDNLHLHKKENMPAIFKPPLTNYNGDNKADIFLRGQAFFISYLNELLKFYDIVEFSDLKYYRCKKIKDPTITNFVDSLYNYKLSTKGKPQYKLVKYLINNLHGKFAQLTMTENFDYVRNNDNIIVKKTREIIDRWDKSHFHYLRGAYIYAMAQAYILKNLYNISEAIDEKEYNLYDILYYSDTDSIVSSIPPDIMKNYISIDSDKLGAFKVEEKYNIFQVYAPKTYAGISIDNVFSITCAGKNKREIIQFLDSKFGKDNLSKLEYLKESPLLPCTILKRTATGASYETEMISFLSQPDELFETDKINR